ncbi:MAG: hypothetical protein HY958_14465 [Bacteroidia bacterium]|nr:hypothetical protein [Bacteroidia bacterium]
MNLNFFLNENLYLAGRKFFQQELGICLSPSSVTNLPAKTLIGDYLKGNDAYLLDEIEEAYLLGKVDDDALQGKNEKVIALDLDTESNKDSGNYNGIIVFAIRTKSKSNTRTRTEIAKLTRALNRRAKDKPVVLLTLYGALLSYSTAQRSAYKQEWREGERVGKITMLKDINLQKVHAGHERILLDMRINPLLVTNYDELYEHWKKVFSVQLLNEQFFKDLANWYFWAQQYVEFPNDKNKEKQKNIQINLIRLITRVIFVWFLKEKNLINKNLFEESFIKKILKSFDPNGEKTKSYFTAILQNLFFATLNQKMEEREFAEDHTGFYKKDHGIKNEYRYPEQFSITKDEVKKLFKEIPFLNGGLFDCLDKENEETKKVEYVDGFSRNVKKTPTVPDLLFFGKERTLDLSEGYGYKRNKEKCRGLLEIFNNYKFTIEENTPIEEEVALDPELLGKVFENLLAYYTPETTTTARKQTGSFYTPREIVNYMVDESLIAYLSQVVIAREERPKQSASNDEIASPAARSDVEEKLRVLLSYSEESHQFSNDDVEHLINAIDNCKILDPACGSGAFPMGILHKLVYVLGRLDKDNVRWRELQKRKAIQDTEKAFNMGDVKQREEKLIEINENFENHTSNYGRKLYLIENCIYGVDIQPIATQIAKLRFFISLVVDQKEKPGTTNRGVKPLPNLETKFVAANTLIGLDKPQQLVLRNPEIEKKENELKELRHKYFSATTRKEKLQYQNQDKKLREEISKLLVNDGWNTTVAKQIVAFDPYDQNTFANWFDPEWMFGLTPNYNQSNYQSDEITILNKQIETVNKQIQTINLALGVNKIDTILKLQFVSAHLQINIIEQELENIKNKIADIVGVIENNVNNVVKEPFDVTYFVNALNKSIKELNIKIDEVSKGLKPPQIGNDGVFDIVIGNPPYISYYSNTGSSLTEAERKFYLDNYQSVVKITDRINSMNLMIEKGIKLLTANGHLSFITNKTIAVLPSYIEVRRFILSNTRVAYFVTDLDPFEAIVDCVVFGLTKEFASYYEIKWLKGGIENFEIKNVSPFFSNTKLEFHFSSHQNILSKIESAKNKLEDLLTINRGVNIGGCFDDFLSETKKSNSYWKYLAGTKNINRYFFKWFEGDGYMKFDLKLEQELRKQGKTLVLGNLDRYKQERLFIPESGQYLMAAYCNEEYYSAYGIMVGTTTNKNYSIKYPCVLINSRLFTFYAVEKEILRKGKKATPHIGVKGFNAIPVYKLSNSQQQPFITLVDKILAAKEKNPEADTSALEKQTDEMVYKLYELTEEEITIIENKK